MVLGFDPNPRGTANVLNRISSFALVLFPLHRLIHGLVVEMMHTILEQEVGQRAGQAIHCCSERSADQLATRTRASLIRIVLGCPITGRYNK